MLSEDVFIAGGDLMPAKADLIKNPYSKRVKKQITINIDVESLEYFKNLAEETGIPYQTLINLYLADCVRSKRRPDVEWK